MVKDSINIDGFRANLEPSIINFVRSNPEMKSIRDGKVTINYSYRDRKGTFLFTISVTPELYSESEKKEGDS